MRQQGGLIGEGIGGSGGPWVSASEQAAI